MSILFTWISSFDSFLAALELVFVLVGKSASSGNFFAGLGFEVFVAASAFLDDFDAVDLGFPDVGDFASPPLRSWRSSASENPPQSDILRFLVRKVVEKYNLLDYYIKIGKQAWARSNLQSHISDAEVNKRNWVNLLDVVGKRQLRGRAGDADRSRNEQIGHVWRN